MAIGKNDKSITAIKRQAGVNYTALGNCNNLIVS